MPSRRLLWRLLGWLVGAACLVLGASGLQAQSPSALPGRTVTVRVFTGTYDPDPNSKTSSTCAATTHSVTDDRRDLGDPQKAAVVVANEERLGYSPAWLVDRLTPPVQTGFDEYLAGNVPTHICYCSGHVLLMAGLSGLQSGPVPPLAAGGDVLYPVAKKLGAPRTAWPQVGDAVFYFKKDNTKPDHVAFVVGAGSTLATATVISKDHTQRVYQCPIDAVNYATAVSRADPNVVPEDKYHRYEVWQVPWSRLKVQVIGGPIEFATAGPVVEPASPWAGDGVKLSFSYRVIEPPAADMVVKAEAALYNALGEQVVRLPTVTLMPVRKPKQGVVPRHLAGEGVFAARVTSPGEHRWVLTITAGQTPSLDEALAVYEPLVSETTFTVRGRPVIDEVKLGLDTSKIDADERSFDPGAELPLAMTISVTGLPDAASALTGPKPQVQLEFQRIDPAGTVTSVKAEPLPAIAAKGMLAGSKTLKFVAGQAPGEHRVKLIVRLEHVPNADPGRSVREAEWTYTVKDRSQTTAAARHGRARSACPAVAREGEGGPNAPRHFAIAQHAGK